MANILDLIAETFTPVRISTNIWSVREHDSLRIWTDSNTFFWYAKGFGGDAYIWLTKVNQFDSIFAKELAEDYGVEEHDYLRKRKSSPQYELYQISGKAIYHPYFAERGLDENTVKHFRLEYDSQSNRAIIPIYRNNLKIGAIVRKTNVTNKKERYKLTLFTAEKPFIWPEDEIKVPLIFEGCWSAMRWWQVLHEKYPEFSYHAILGAYPQKKIRELFNGLVPIFILDNDNAGIKMIEHLDKLKMPYKHYTPEIYPDELTDKQILKLIKRIKKEI